MFFYRYECITQKGKYDLYDSRQSYGSYMFI